MPQPNQNFPDAVIEIARQENRRNPNDIAKATELALAKIQRLPIYNDALQQKLLALAVREIIQDIRHSQNSRILSQARRDVPAVASALSRGRAQHISAQLRMLDLYIGGRQLGEIYGREYNGLIAEQGEQASTATFKKRLLEKLQPHVPEDKRTKDAVSEKFIRDLACDISSEIPIPPEFEQHVRASTRRTNPRRANARRQREGAPV